MKTFLHRILDSISSGNIKILALELTIVATGLVIGFQIDRMYEQYRDNQLAEQYIQRLTDDIQSDLDNLVNVHDAASFRKFATETIYASINDLEIPASNPGLYIVSLEQAIYRFSLVSQHATYNELLSTGELNLLPVPVRISLHEYYGRVAVWEQFDAAEDFIQDQSYQRFAGILLPEHIQGAMSRDVDMPVTREEAMAAAHRFREKQEAIEWIPRLRAQHVGAIRVANELSALAEAALGQLEQFSE
ncbi:MAG: hypothetical protein RL839_14415 [Gammaproteobacteria bacterium]